MSEPEKQSLEPEPDSWDEMMFRRNMRVMLLADLAEWLMANATPTSTAEILKRVEFPNGSERTFYVHARRVFTVVGDREVRRWMVDCIGERHVGADSAVRSFWELPSPAWVLSLEQELLAKDNQGGQRRLPL